MYIADRIADAVKNGAFWNATGQDWLSLYGSEDCNPVDFSRPQWVARLLLRRAESPADEAFGVHGQPEISTVRITLPLPVIMDLAAAAGGDKSQMITAVPVSLCLQAPLTPRAERASWSCFSNDKNSLTRTGLQLCSLQC